MEISADWFAEAVWAGPFGAGEIDHTDLIFGSGGRLREGRVVFVSSGSTLDRLVAYQGTVTYVSNSLVALLATLDARVDPAYPQYYTDFRSITKGVDEYKPFLSTSSGPVRLIYFRNLEWDGCSFQVTEKPGRDRSFNGFEDYAGFMKQSLAEIGRNMHDVGRQHAYRPLGTLQHQTRRSHRLVLDGMAPLGRISAFPVPFFAARNSDQIHRISNSPEMKAWSVGGNYDRLICRRILESAGVPRGLFAKAKSAASVVLWNPQENFLPPESMNSYRAWLRRHQLAWLRTGRLPPPWKILKHKLGSAVRRSKASEAAVVDSYFAHLFPWSLELAIHWYRQEPGAARVAGQSASGG